MSTFKPQSNFIKPGKTVISEKEIAKQLMILKNGVGKTRIIRPCVVRDGIKQFSSAEFEKYVNLFDENVADFHLLKFIPASGAASRMFNALRDIHSEQRRIFLENIHHFAFASLFKERIENENELISYLLDEHGLDFLNIPKGMIPFHKYKNGYRTAFGEHMAETILWSEEGCSIEIHFTVSESHQPAVEKHINEIKENIAKDRNILVSYSVQQHTTDTISIDVDDKLVKDKTGAVLMRPSGHGALLKNLNELDADLIFIKNIDNVQPDRIKSQMLKWKKALAGYLIELKLQQKVEKPLRVCGMVRNQAEPGGGPFWVDNGKGESLQIVEKAQIDLSDRKQEKLFNSATHFNPVDIVCSFKRSDGTLFNLSDYCDEDACIITEKYYQGQPIRTLERPGLWNGGMAGWQTFFVEVPLLTFTPVKMVNDLLRPEHQNF